MEKPNPFAHMTHDEREQLIERMRNFNSAIEVNTAWVHALVAKYAPNHAWDDQRRLLSAELQARVTRELQGEQKEHIGPSVVLARSKRSAGFDVTRDGSSWFGGLPALGDMAWPRGSDGGLMTPLAQIDLTGLAAHLQVPGLPNQGSLAFFASFPEAGEGMFGGSVRYVPGPARQPTQPDGPLPKVENNTYGGPLRRGEPAEAQVLFPRQAVELVPVTASGAELRAEVERVLGPAPAKSLQFGLAGEAAPGPGQPYNRDSLLRFLLGARVALGSGEAVEKTLHRILTSLSKSRGEWAAGLEANPDRRDEVEAGLERVGAQIRRVEDKLSRFDGAEATLGASLAVLEAWGSSGDRWQPLTEVEQEHLAPLLHDWTDYNGLGRAHLDETYEVHRGIGDCVTETLLVMAVAEDAVFERLPQALREAVNGPYRQPRRGVFHKMFGEPSSIQEAAFANQGSYLLLQLQCDDLAGFHWGDMGVLQFWITPNALKEGRWEEAYLTFEGN